LHSLIERTGCGFGKFGPNGFGQAFASADGRRGGCGAHKLDASHLCQFIAQAALVGGR
jgi:hypothetical protein